MIGKRRPVILWVDPAFHKMVKIKSANNGLPIVKYTRLVAEEERKESIEGNKTKRRLFNFDSF